MKNSNKLYFDAGLATWLLGADKNDTTHPTMTYRLDHEIDGEQLLEAWKRALRVYPVLDCALDLESKHLLFCEAGSELQITHSPNPVRPCSELTGGRPVSLSWYGNSFTMVTFHSVMDGTGIVSVVKTLVYEYCRIHFNKDFDPAGIILKEGRSPDEYYKTQNNIDLGEYDMCPLALQPVGEDIFSDGEMRQAEGGILTGSAKISSPEFISACKSIGASPAVMLCIIFGRAVYGMDESERRRMEFALTLDERATLGLSGTLGQCSTLALLGASYDELMNGSLSDTASRMRSALNKQRESDYVKTYIAISKTYAIFCHQISAVISYEGRLDFGSCSEHVTGMSMVNNTANTLHMVELGGNMILTFQFGEATEKYMKAVLLELEKTGVKSEIISSPSFAKPEIR